MLPHCSHRVLKSQQWGVCFLIKNRSDRLRAVQCPSDMIDQIGGWATAGVGQAYGEGYGIISLFETLKGISLA